MKVDFVSLESKISGDTTLKCPQCGFEYLHPISVSIHRKNDKTAVTNEAIIVKEEENKTRGVTITMEYCCEDGHHGELTFQFHKGVIYVEHKPLEPTCDILKNIWRD